MSAGRDPGGRVFDPDHRALAIGLLLTITMIGFEALGVATAMPVVAEKLHGLSLYGWVFSASTLASLVGTAVAGRRVDRMGPARPFGAGLSLFALGLLIGGLAPSMPVLVAGRFVQGLGAGVIPPVIYASIGRSFGQAAQARMFALLSSAWVVPGLVGPAVSGYVAEHLGWRFVFLGLLPLLPLNAVLALPALRRLRAVREENDQTAGLTARAVLLAAGSGLLLAGLGLRNLVGPVLVIAGAAIALPALRHLLPDGSLMARAGLPAAVATRGLQTFAFFGAEAFVPLALTAVRGTKPVTAGLVLTAGVLSWTTGAWIQERTWRRFGRRSLVVVGLTCITVSIAAVALVLVPAVPVAMAAAAWFVGGFGMGISYSSISLTVLAEAAPGEEGSASAAVTLADVLGVALGTGIGGAAVAASKAITGAPRNGITAAFAIAFVAGAVGIVTARRLPPGHAAPTALPVQPTQAPSPT